MFRTRKLHGLAVGAAVLASTIGATACQPATPQATVRALCFPVQGPNSYQDWFGAPRSGGRSHEGQDIMASKMQKILSATSGTVISLKHQSSGNYLYVRDDTGWVHAYNHINNDRPGTDDGSNLWQHAFAPGLHVGQRVRAGEHVAYLGDSGNAETTGAHLHYELRKPNGSYSGVAVNAYASLRAAKKCTVLVPGSTFKPFDSPDSQVRRQYRDFLGLDDVSQARVNAWVSKLDTGTTRDKMLAEFVATGEFKRSGAPVVRLFSAYFSSAAKPELARAQMGAVARGKALAVVSDELASSSEFRRQHGSMSNDAFVSFAYLNALGRAASPAELDSWTAKLTSSEATRGALMVALTQSPAAVSRSDRGDQVAAVWLAMLHRYPSASTISTWAPKGAAAMASSLFGSAEYARRADS